MMMRHRAVVLVAAGIALLVAQAQAAQQNVLVLCTADQCEFRPITAFFVGGNSMVRLPGEAVKEIAPSDVGKYPEAKFDKLPGLARDPESGIVWALTTAAARSEPAIPGKLKGKTPVSPSSAWQGEALEYIAPGSKARVPVPLDSFAYLLLSANAEQSAFNLFQRLLNSAEGGSRRPKLILGALKFANTTPESRKWRELVLVKVRDGLQRYDDQAGDPATLVDSLREVVLLRKIYLELEDQPENRDLFARISSADDLLNGRLAVVDALRSASLWDEYLAKLRQMGLLKWSVAEMVAHEREAFRQASQVHLERSQAFDQNGHLDRAFDEAELAARYSCDPLVHDYFYNARVKLVNHNLIPSSLEYSGPNKVLLEQIVRELDQLDPTKEQRTLDRIRQGEAYDQNFLPLQWKKAEFLDKLGKYSDALAVVRRIERDVRLDRAQLEQGLGLDGRINNNLLDSIQKAQAETRAQFDQGRYQPALKVAGDGLKADSGNAGLLYYSALSSAFLRHSDEALKFIRAYLKDGNVACAPQGEPEKMLGLFRYLAAPVSLKDAPDGVPHWISGIRYRLGEVYYDPISVGFLQPIGRISSSDGLTTLFRREDRSYLVSFISTSKATPNATSTSTGAVTTLFEAEPKYDRSTLSMLEIGSRPSPTGERIVHALTYANSPTIDPELVFRFAGKRIARGWSGNPFFHPFIWTGFYVFDLTYDDLGRVILATPVREQAGARADRLSEPLEFVWQGTSNVLLSIKGTRSGYLRQMYYDKQGLLLAEKITSQRGGGSIEYTYWPRSAQLASAKFRDNSSDFRDGEVFFDWGGRR